MLHSGSRLFKSLRYLIFQFYAESAEADLWMNDRKLYLTSKDFGKDEDSVQASPWFLKLIIN